MVDPKREKEEQKRLEKERKDAEKREKEEAKRRQKEQERLKKEQEKAAKTKPQAASPKRPPPGVRSRNMVLTRILLLDSADFEVEIDVSMTSSIEKCSSNSRQDILYSYLM